MTTKNTRAHLSATVLLSCLIFSTVLYIYYSIAQRFDLLDPITIFANIPGTQDCVPFQIETTFVEQRKYMSMSHDYDYLWADLLPENGGFVQESYEEDVEAGIAMFHQLHCLQMIRMAVQQLQNPENSSQEHHHHSEKRAGTVASNSIHWRHCFDYLQQVGKSNPTDMKRC